MLLNLHTVPMGQNGFDNGGISGVCKWAQRPEEIEFVMTVLERLAERYESREGLMGIEVLNEPISERVWRVMNVPVRYPAADSAYVPVICGEWCMFNSYLTGHDTKGGQSVLNGLDFSDQREVFSEEKKREVYQAITAAQLKAWDQGEGYFYWSYKLLLDTVNDGNWIGWDSWDLGKSAALGWW